MKCRHSALGIREKKRAGNETVQCVIVSVLKEAWAVPPPSCWLINNTAVITFTVWFEGPWPHGGAAADMRAEMTSVNAQCKRSASCLPAHCRLHRGGSFRVGLECQHTRSIEKFSYMTLSWDDPCYREGHCDWQRLQSQRIVQQGFGDFGWESHLLQHDRKRTLYLVEYKPFINNSDVEEKWQ